MIARHRGLYVVGWSPTHQQPICVPAPQTAKTWPDAAAFAFWYAHQPGSCNYGGVGQFDLLPDADPMARAVTRALMALATDILEGVVVLCPECKTQLAFDGDVCALCHPTEAPDLTRPSVLCTCDHSRSGVHACWCRAAPTRLED